MTTPKIYEIAALDAVADVLRRAPQKILPYIERAMFGIVRDIQQRLAVYPPSTAANRPGRVDNRGRPMGYYERGRGWWYPVMRAQTLGGKLGASFGAELADRAEKRHGIKSIPTKVVGYKLESGGTSEMLGRSWDAQVETGADYVLGVIANNASYAPYVQGVEQSALHASRNWKTIDGVIDASMPDIEQLLNEAVDEYIKDLLDS